MDLGLTVTAYEKDVYFPLVGVFCFPPPPSSSLSS
jgi:hypothetical protein